MKFLLPSDFSLSRKQLSSKNSQSCTTIIATGALELLSSYSLTAAVLELEYPFATSVSASRFGEICWVLSVDNVSCLIDCAKLLRPEDQLVIVANGVSSEEECKIRYYALQDLHGAPVLIIRKPNGVAIAQLFRVIENWDKSTQDTRYRDDHSPNPVWGEPHFSMEDVVIPPKNDSEKKICAVVDASGLDKTALFLGVNESAKKSPEPSTEKRDIVASAFEESTEFKRRVQLEEGAWRSTLIKSIDETSTRNRTAAANSAANERASENDASHKISDVRQARPMAKPEGNSGFFQRLLEKP